MQNDELKLSINFGKDNMESSILLHNFNLENACHREQLPVLFLGCSPRSLRFDGEFEMYLHLQSSYFFFLSNNLKTFFQ